MAWPGSSQATVTPLKTPEPSPSDSAAVGAISTPRTFATAAAKPRLTPRFRPVDLSARQYSAVDGKPSIHFTAAEFDAGVALFKHSLIAKFTMGRPSIEEIRRVFKEHWPVKGRATVSDIWDSRHLMIILDSEEDAKVALTSPLRKVGHAMFRLFRYTPDYSPRRESTTTTKWVRLPDLHPGFVTRNYVAGIVNSFGYFLDLDERSKACSTLKYARACVEIDVTKEIPEEVRISLSDGRIFWQKIEVEGNLFFCSHCKIHGHALADCRKKKSPRSEIQSNHVGGSRDTNVNKDARSIAVTIPGGHELKGNNSNTQSSHREWIEVKRKKGGYKVVHFQPVDGNNKHGELDTGVALKKQGSSIIGETQNVVKEIVDESFLPSFSEPEKEDYESNNVAVQEPNCTQDEEANDPASAMILYNEGEIIGENNDGESSKASTEGMDSEASTEDENDKRHSSEMLLSEETAKRISSYGDLLYSAEEGGLIDPKAIYMYLRKAGEEESFIFEYLDDFVNENRQVQQDDSGTPFEESGTHNDQVESVDPSMLSNIPSLKKTRQGKKKKKKGSRSSTRSCPKKKDNNFVWT